jgi:hypothetical protein
VDIHRWKTDAHFASWLGLCPDNRVSGDKVLRRGTRLVGTAPPTHCGKLPAPHAAPTWEDSTSPEVWIAGLPSLLMTRSSSGTVSSFLVPLCHRMPLASWHHRTAAEHRKLLYVVLDRK